MMLDKDFFKANLIYHSETLRTQEYKGNMHSIIIDRNFNLKSNFERIKLTLLPHQTIHRIFVLTEMFRKFTF